MGWAGIALVVAMAVATLLRLRRRVVVIDVSGVSMAPTLNPGDRVLVRRVSLAAVSRGMIVVVAGPYQGPRRPRRSSRHLARQRWVVKRAMAIPGDPVPKEMAKATGAAPGTPVPYDHFLVVGDNSSMSTDSRMYGFVPADRLLGVVVRQMQ